MLAVGFVGIRMLGQGALSMISTVTVQLRFVKQRGLSIGVFAMMGGALMALVPVALTAVIEVVSWRSAWRLSAVFIWCSVVPLGFFGLRSMPRGLKTAPTTDLVANTPLAGMTRDEAVRTRSFWIIATIATVSSMLSTAFNFHQFDLLGDVGLTETEAASMFLPQTIGAIIAGLLIGIAADRIGTRYLPLAPMIILLGVHLLGAGLARGPVVFAYSIALGAMGGATRSAVTTLLPTWFGTAHIGAIQGVLTLAVVAGSALGPVALSLTEERLGGYSSAFLVLGVIPVAASIFAATAPRPARLGSDPERASGA
ncbi:MAG: MFS transporter [Acidimicrobiales bacterium]